MPSQMNNKQQIISWYKNTPNITMAGVAQWIEHRPTGQMGAGLIPTQGTCLGCRPGPRWDMQEATTH